MQPLASRMAVMTGEGALSVNARARELERQGRSIIHLELGEPDFHPAPQVNDALKRALDEGKDRYCAVAGVPALREAIARYLHETRNLNVSPDDIVLAPGCKLALFLAMMALIDPGDEVLYPDPGFPGYSSITVGLSGVAVPFELSERNRFQPDPEEIAAKITPRTKILITNSPGNPTGTVYTDETQRRLAELAVKHDLIVLSDEIYARIIYGATVQIDDGLSRHGRAHPHPRRVLQELRHDRMAPRLHGCPCPHRSGLGHAGHQQLHLRRRIQPVRRHRSAA